MPKQKSNSSFAQRAGDKLRKAHEAHKNDETKYSGGGNLPAGIEGGVAQLISIGFGVYESGDNKGKDYFRAAGVIVSPREFTDDKNNVHRLEGKQTSIQEVLFDTPERSGRKTFDDHYAWVLNELRKLGVNTKEVSYDNIEATCEALVQVAPYFGFRTWKGKPTDEYPDPRTNETWEGVLENYEPDTDATHHVKDNTAQAPKSSGGGSKTPAGNKAPPADNADVPFGDKLDMLADQATAGDEAASIELKELAMSVGVTEDECDNAADWAAVADLARAAEAGGGDAGGGDDVDPVALATAAEAGDQEAADKLQELAFANGISEDDWNQMGWEDAGNAVAEAIANGGAAADDTPKVGDTWKYAPMDPKTKKPVAKAIECTVLAVDEAKKTANLKNLDDGKTTYKSVPWDKLVSVAG